MGVSVRKLEVHGSTAKIHLGVERNVIRFAIVLRDSTEKQLNSMFGLIVTGGIPELPYNERNYLSKVPC